MTAIKPTTTRPVTTPPASTPTTSTPGAAAPASTTPAAQPAAQDAVATTPAQGAEAQTLKDFAAAQQTKEVSAVDFGKMTQEQQYDYLQKLTVQQAAGDKSAWKTGKGEINLVGVRSMQDGKPGDASGDAYNDTIYACRIVDGKKEVHAFRASTDAGVHADPQKSGLGYYDASGQFAGMTHLADGFYRDAFRRGPVAGGEFGLRQQGLVRLQADSNNDGVIQDGEKLGKKGEGLLAGPRVQIQFHRGAGGDRVGESSAGCQAIHPDDWGRFQNLLAQAPKSQDLNGSGRGFSYLLTDASKLPPPDSDFTALRRKDVDQRTVFQQPPGDTWFGGEGGSVDDAFTQGIIDDKYNTYAYHPFGGDSGSDPNRTSHEKNAEFELQRSNEDNAIWGRVWSGVRGGAASRGGLDLSYGNGIGIVRTPGNGVTSDRVSAFDFWLRY